MPYIAIKAYPKDEETKKKVVSEINEIFLKYWGCPPEAISISMENFPPEEWEEKVVKPEIEKKTDKMMILSGEKKF
ncbi:MAG: tautomerase family protein [Clostridia bacterium]|nr:tautomerase family protein [Clostridia bacterium]